MNDTEKTIKILEAMQADISTLKRDTAATKDSVSHLTTAMKAVPTKKDVEEIVDTAVDAAKTELKSDILNLDAKVIRKLQRHGRRIENIEEHDGIENPEKN